MIPPFDENGCLPPGIHRASFAEVEARFGRQSELRRVQTESLRWMVESARRAGVSRVILNGSFVCDIIEPNDVDCVLLIGRGYPFDAHAEKALENGWPFLDLAIVGQRAFDEFVGDIFAADRQGTRKGMIEVVL